jgi:anti-sigma factor RsiW
MKFTRENELFSAYVDGELSAEQRAEVEQLTAADPAARRLVEEFRALRSTIQALPVHKLKEDLSQRVLRSAERQVLSGTDRKGNHGLDIPRALGANEPRWKPVLRRLLKPRTLLWPLAAAAAAILIAVFHSGGPRSVNPNAGNDRVAARSTKEANASGQATDRTAPALERKEVASISPASPPGNPAVLKAPASPENTAPTTAHGPTPSVGSAVAQRDNPSRPAGVEKTPFASGNATVAKEAGPSPAIAKGGVPPGPSIAGRESDKLMIVQCEVTNDWALRGAFEEALKKQEMRVKALTADPQDPLATLVRRLTTSVVPVSENGPRPRMAGTRPLYLRVEATPAQIDAAVADLKAHPEKFPFCSVRFAPLSPTPGKPEAKEGAPRSVIFEVHLVPESREGAAPAVPESAKPAGPTK